VAWVIAICASSMVSSSPVTGRVMAFSISYDGTYYCINVMEMESGASLALPVWIDFMAAALKNVPVQELSAPEDVIKVDGDWRYSDWALGGGIVSLGMDDQAIGPGLIAQPSTPQATATSTVAPASAAQ
jgi:membrane carboxypeptidase/penicillin-binding protein